MGKADALPWPCSDETQLDMRECSRLSEPRMNCKGGPLTGRSQLTEYNYRVITLVAGTLKESFLAPQAPPFNTCCKSPGAPWVSEADSGGAGLAAHAFRLLDCLGGYTPRTGISPPSV